MECSGSLVRGSANLLDTGFPPENPDDSRYIHRGRSGVPDVRTWPGLTIERYWRVNEGGKDRQIRIHCYVKEGSDGPVFGSTAFLEDDDQLTAEGSSMSSTARELLKRLPGASGSGETAYININGPNFFGLRTSSIAKVLDAGVIQEKENVEPTSSASPQVQPVPVHSQPKRRCCVHVISTGEIPKNKEEWLRTFGGEQIQLMDGFKSCRSVNTISGVVDVICSVARISDSESTPQFKVSCGDHSFSALNPTTPVKQLLEEIGATTKHQFNGAEFFGFLNKGLLPYVKPDEPAAEPKNITSTPRQRTCTKAQPLIVQLEKLRARGGGPTSDLKSKRSRDQRNQAINEVVIFASFGDVPSYVRWLCSKHPEILDETLQQEECQDYVQRLSENLSVHVSMNLSEKESAELLLGRASLTQRAYKAIRSTLQRKNVHLARYEKVMHFIHELNVGAIFEGCEDDSCMCAATSFKKTLSSLVSTPEIFSKMEFPSTDQQKRLFARLQEMDPILYDKLNASHRTLFLREGGDNFRAAGRHPTEQDSFLVLNIKELVSSPNGQVVNGLWRGSEDRETLRRHLAATYSEIDEVARNGVNIKLSDDTTEHFNVIVFYVSDLGHKKEVLGRTSVSALYGCMHCKKSRRQWGRGGPPGQALSMEEIKKLGNKAKRVLGDKPDKTSSQYTAFHQSHFGQTGEPLLHCYSDMCNLDCGLHIILAIHRQLMKVVMHIVKKRKQEAKVADALRAAGCNYLAFQMESYYASKQKYYDGNVTLKMTGEDCRKLEKNINKFAHHFVESGSVTSHGNELLLGIVNLYTQFHSIASDLRSTTSTSSRVESLQRRVDTFVTLFLSHCNWDCAQEVPYIHVLQDHVPKWTKFWFDMLGWGYGMFSSTSGEHLNKIVKFLEMGHTNFSGNRFQQILRLLRLQMLHFPTMLFDHPGRKMVCGSCGQAGHNKKSRSCPMHPSQPPMEFDDGDAQE